MSVRMVCTSTRGADVPFHEMSHGESFLALLESRFDEPGFYCLDEPEAALSFNSTLALIAVLVASINIFGGFLVTQRMLAMYKKKG
mgnify:CR=1 FL=1